MPEVGDTVSFVPSAFTDYSPVVSRMLGAVTTLHGRIVQVHEEHRWYRVAAPYEGGVLYECFKF